MSEITIPTPTFSWTTVWQAVKIVLIVVIFMAAQQGIQAFTNTFDWSKLMEAGEVAKVLMAVAMGTIFGAIQGVLRAAQILVAVWAGPSVWGYLGPILASASAAIANTAAAVARVFRGNKKETTSS